MNCAWQLAIFISAEMLASVRQMPDKKKTLLRF